MSHPVFISYARDASRAHAEALYNALGPETAFLDTEDIGVGEPFPERLVDALFGARVVVIFAEPGYFTRRYCLYEFNVACEPFLRVAERPGATAAEKETALRGIVLALPARGVDPMLERFPPGIQGINWPSADNPAEVAAMVRRELAANPPTLRERYQAIGDDAAERAKLLATTRLPTPMRIGTIPFVPALGLRTSIGDAFVGRADDIWRIHHVLTSRRGDLRNAAGLTGSLEAGGGFGKTRLALEYLYRFGTRQFRGGLFWINAEADPELQFYEVLQALNPSAPPIEIIRAGQGGVAGAVARAIRGLPEDGSPPLFIIDNVPEPEPNQRPLPLDTWCPVPGEVSVLATSRTQVALVGGGVVPIRIETLAPDAAVRLLTAEVPREQLTEAEWHEIATWVGHLPLALELLNSLLRSGAITPLGMLGMSREQHPSTVLDEGMEALRNSVPAGALRGITDAFAASYDRLTPEEQYAARLIAWLAPEPVPEFVIEALGLDIFTPSIRAVLRNRSFVAEVRSGSGEYFGAMHRVLADYLRRRSTAVDEEISFVASTLGALIDSATGQGDAGARMVRGTAPLISAFSSHRLTAGADSQQFMDSFWFGMRTGNALLNWGLPELAGYLWGIVSHATERSLGKEHPHTLGVKSEITRALRARGDLAGAQELQERVLEVRRRILGEEHPDTLASMNNLAATLSDRGNHAGAQELQERVLEARRRILGEEHSDTLSSMNNLASILRERGDSARAQELLERVLEVRRRILGEEHPDTLVSMNNLAATLSIRGDLTGARVLQERALTTWKRILGEEHPNTLASMSDFAGTLRAEGDLAGAQDLEERVLEARRRTLGEEHPATLRSMSNLALTLREQGDLMGAQELQERVLKARQRTLGEEHPDTLVSMNNLANTLSDQEDYARAQELQERVLKAMHRILGEEHPNTSISAWNLVLTLEARRQNANPIIGRYLRWMLKRDPHSLAGVQRKIRGYLKARQSTTRPSSSGKKSKRKKKP